MTRVRRFAIIGRRGERPETELRPGQLLFGLALTIGLLLRLGPLLGGDFPLLDGGLFTTMASDIRQAHFAVPYWSSFNAGNVPFAYPPLGLFVLAAIPGDPIQTERWLPLVYSLLAIGFAYLLARELTGETRAGLAALLFAAMPITWTIEGGGVTRGLGLAFLTAFLWRVAILMRSPTARNAVVAGIVGAIPLLSHPGVGPIGLASALLLLAMAPSRRRVAALGGAGLVAFIVILPWLIMVMSRYGSSAFLTAASVSDGVGANLLWLLTVGPSWGEPLDFVVPLALLGAVVLVHRRDWLLPLWILLAILVPGALGRNTAIVWAMMAAVGVATLAESLKSIGARRLGAVVGLVWVAVASFTAGYQRYAALAPAVREAMVAAGAGTAPGTTFAIVSVNNDVRGLARDWFPALSGRVSLGTSMGLEWTSMATYQGAIDRDHEIQAGHLPPETDAVLTISGDSAWWSLLH